jgi:nucleoid DNA-binding protein
MNTPTTEQMTATATIPEIQEEMIVPESDGVSGVDSVDGGEESATASKGAKAARVNDLVDELSAAFPEVTKAKLKAIVDATFKRVIPDLIDKHQALKIVDFASIQLVMRKATRRKLPNGTRVVTPEHKALRFSAYTALEDKLGMSDYKSVPETDAVTEEEAPAADSNN